MKMKNKLIQVFIITSMIGLLLSLIPTPSVLADVSYNLEVTNLAGTNFSFTGEQLLAMPKTMVHADLLCYGSLVTSGNWGGVLLSYLLNLTQATPEVLSLGFVASDGYIVNIPIDLAMQPQIIIAYELNSEFLPQGLRLVLPGYNGAAWIAMITSISMSSLQVQYPAPNTAQGIIPMPSDTHQSTPPQQATAPPQQTTPENSPSNQTTNPANVTNPNQTASSPQLSNNEGKGIQVVFFYSIASALVIVLAVLGGLAYRRKKWPLKTS
jgi:DMSO/TMAO reductase YedYZ molybdopterin-dependent catalytic subunit